MKELVENLKLIYNPDSPIQCYTVSIDFSDKEKLSVMLFDERSDTCTILRTKVCNNVQEFKRYAYFLARNFNAKVHVNRVNQPIVGIPVRHPYQDYTGIIRMDLFDGFCIVEMDDPKKRELYPCGILARFDTLAVNYKK